ncbi:MAG TPA: pentapeptide repeat-containing protein [Streptosporangiaceae bacterium]|nr:pentapeptide repeat-containing protein [Streptosporangiaceae bacterium]
MVVRGRPGARALALIAASCVAAGTLAFSAGSADAAVSCPSVNPSTGAVTPPPSAGTDWSGCNLTGAYLYDAPLTDMNLTDANLTNADLAYATISSNLTDANLSGATMTGDNLSGATITGADMATASIAGVWTFNTVGVPASLPSGWEDVDSYILGPTANLTYAILNGQDLAGYDLDQANLTSASLTKANLSGTDLAQATLAEVESGGITGTPTIPAGWLLINGYLVGAGADLDGATLTGADLVDADLTGTDFSGANLASADLAGASMNAATLTSASLADANLTNSDATGAVLYEAILTKATLTGTILTKANLDAANLTNTDLSQSTLTSVQSGDVIGSPVLPTNWALFNGYLVGPTANLANASLAKLSLSGADLNSSNLSDADLTGSSLPSADLVSANLSGANLTSATLTSSDLTDATVTDANLTNADLDQATTSDAVWTGVTWFNTTCPDGSNSNAHDSGCFSPLNTTPPVAHPGLLSTGSEVNGWFNAPVTVAWNWSDAGPLSSATCTMDSTTTTNGPVTLTATCTDLAGNTATDSYQLNVDTTRPVVKVTGVTASAHYVVGKVPAAGCMTTESISGVAEAAQLSTSTGGSDGVGPFTATCAGAVSVAGNPQAGPAQAKYTVGYGFGGFAAPRSGSTVRASAHHIAVRFRLVNAKGTAISDATAKALAWAHDARVTLTGPGIRATSAFCSWSAQAHAFSCTLKIPATVKTGRRAKYALTAEENVGTGFYAVPDVGRTTNPERIHFS